MMSDTSEKLKPLAAARVPSWPRRACDKHTIKAMLIAAEKDAEELQRLRAMEARAETLKSRNQIASFLAISQAVRFILRGDDMSDRQGAGGNGE